MHKVYFTKELLDVFGGPVCIILIIMGEIIGHKILLFIESSINKGS